MEILLGTTVEDRITKRRGVATGRCTYITGSVRICIEGGFNAEGTPLDAAWFDEERLEVVSA